MKRLYLYALLFLSGLSLSAKGAADSRDGENRGVGNFTFVEYNCENLFDCRHDSLKQDADFMPEGRYMWTPSRYWKKQNNIARTILACGEKEDGSSALPDLVALCEIENDTVIRDLTRRTLLRNANYEYIVTNSPDQRGIDVALLYTPLTFRVLDSHPVRVTPITDMKPTRDILYVKGMTASEDTLHVFVVHAPSRGGGEYETRKNRLHVAERLIESVDSIRSLSPDAKIVATGDFNDYTDSPSLVRIAEAGMPDASKDAVGENGAKGTYKYRGEWASLDHFMATASLARHIIRCQVADRKFLLCPDERDGGVCPYRNFMGVKWQDAYSDHLPLVMELNF